MNMQTFVCNKDRNHYLTRLSDETENRLACISCDGWMSSLPEGANTVPFQLWCFIGFWKPICVKHKRIFMFESRYYRDHASCGGHNYPCSDLAIGSLSYRKVWLP